MKASKPIKAWAIFYWDNEPHPGHAGYTRTTTIRNFLEWMNEGLDEEDKYTWRQLRRKQGYTVREVTITEGWG